ncbi:hypothetical protein Hamer_G014603 [Homarus americanus]|uniref:Uncharacterized protein n=1 Tax=Homarus americanus TaxID=6706 RepID=A0A8J5N4H0_HOMAM|nr:hypothetical protein Hamer_G014603 [Homarus americanus]
MEGGGGSSGEGDNYQLLASLVKKDPGLVSLLNQQDFHAFIIILKVDVKAWAPLGSVLAALLESDRAKADWLSQEDAQFLGEEAATSLLKGLSVSLQADLLFLKEFVPSPTVDEVVVVINASRLLIKQTENNLWSDDAVVRNLCTCLDILHKWRVPLIQGVPNWSDSLMRWCRRFEQPQQAYLVLEKTLVLLQDFLEGVEPGETSPWLVLLVDVFRGVRVAWSRPAQPGNLVCLANITTLLTQILNTLPGSVTPDFQKAFLEQLLLMIDLTASDETSTFLPSNTLEVVAACVCRLLAQADPQQLLWVVNTFSTPTLVVQAVDQTRKKNCGECFNLELRASIVTELLRVLNHYSLAVFLMTVRKLASTSNVPHLKVVSGWFCSVVAAGASLDASSYYTTGEDGSVAFFIDRLIQHFQSQHDILYLQAITLALVSSERSREYVRESHSFFDALQPTKMASSATRGASVLVAYKFAPSKVFSTLLGDSTLDDILHDVHECLTSELEVSPRFLEVLRSVAPNFLEDPTIFYHVPM